MISLIGFISVLGVAVGVASLIIVLSVMNGFDNEVREKIIGTYAHVVVLKQEGITDYNALMSDLEKMPEVKTSTGFITGQAILRKNDQAIGILLKGIDTKKESRVTEVITYTDLCGAELTENTIILGSELMKKECVKPGDVIEILIPYAKFDLGRSELKVIGSFNSGRYDYDVNIAIVSLETARKIFRMQDTVTGIALKIKDEIAAEKVKARLQEKLGYPYVVKSWMDFDRNLVTALALEKKMMFIILAMIIMVAGFSICGALIMMVMEKVRDIGILKAVGANSFGISMVFLIEGSIIGLTGVMTGAFFGIFIAERVNALVNFIERAAGITIFPNDVYYFTEIPVKINMQDIWAVVLVALILTLAAGIYPAWKASRLDPVEAIRYE